MNSQLPLKTRLIELVSSEPGLTDRELTDRLFDRTTGHQPVNQAARGLEQEGLLRRRKRSDGKIGNYRANSDAPMTSGAVVKPNSGTSDGLSEDDVKRAVEAWLRRSGWHVEVKWGRDHGIDIVAKRGNERWLIEAKGCGLHSQARHNYFLGMLGELLQGMNDSGARYSIALPQMKQFRSLWQRLPALAKSRMRVSALFVDTAGEVEEVDAIATNAQTAG